MTMQTFDTSSVSSRSVLGVSDLTADEIGAITRDALRGKLSPPDRGALDGVGAALLFEKPSLRTRASFEFGLGGLGANVVYFDLASQRIGVRESVKDYAKNLERWCDIVIARVYDHNVLVELAEHAS
ncbi:MAG: hypothetical protein AAGF47_02025, partial [Planctomycetota bacterium]